MDDEPKAKIIIASDVAVALEKQATDCATIVVATVPEEVSDADGAALARAARRLLTNSCILWLKLPRETMADAINADHWVQLESRPQHLIYQFAMSPHPELTKESRRALNEALIAAKYVSNQEPFPLQAIDVILRDQTTVGDTVLDLFARSGATGAMANWLGRHTIQIVPNRDIANAVWARTQKALKARRERQAAQAAPPVAADEPSEPATTEEPAPECAPFVPLAVRRRVRAPEAMPAAFVPPAPPPTEEPFAAPPEPTFGDLHGHPGCHGCQMCWPNDPAIHEGLLKQPEPEGAKVAYSGEGWAVLQGDTIGVLPCFPEACFDSCVTDPPYGLSEEPDASEVLSHWLKGDRYTHGKGGFMGKSWDSFVPGPEYWREVYRVLKPGAYLLAMSSSRTWDLLSMAIRLAGFETRDTIAVHGVPAISWTYGQGFPKSHDVSKAIDKHLGVARKVVGFGSAGQGSLQRESRVAQGYRENLTDVDPTSYPITAAGSPEAKEWDGWGSALKPAHEVVLIFRKPLIGGEVDIQHVVETELRERGVVGVIQWRSEPANVVDSPSALTSLSSTAQPRTGATSVASAVEPETVKFEPQTQNDSVSDGISGPLTTLGDNGSSLGNTIGSYVTKSSTRTAASASAAESENAHSSPSTMLKEGEPHIDAPPTTRSMPKSVDKDSQSGIEFFAGIATGLTGSLARVRINRAVDGMFLWPRDLPKRIRGKRLTIAENVLTHRTGALNIDGCRIEGAGAVRRINTNPGMGGGQYGANAYESGSHGMRETTEGRWPSNVVLCHAPNCVLNGTKKVKGAAPFAGNGTGEGSRPGGFMDVGAEAGAGLPNSRSYTDADGMETVEDWSCAPGCAVAAMNQQSGIRKSGGAGVVRATAGAHQGNCYGVYERAEGQPLMVYADEGGASRYFPTTAWEPGEIEHAFRFVSKASKRERGFENGHPTVKPSALMQWLVRLVTPKGGMVLDPFCGSGTTGLACMRERFQFTGVEMDDEFANIAQRRVGAEAPTHVSGCTVVGFTEDGMTEAWKCAPGCKVAV